MTPEPIPIPGGGMLPGGLRALGIGSIPVDIPTLPPEEPAPLPPEIQMSPSLPPPPGVTPLGQAEAPAGALPPSALPSASPAQNGPDFASPAPGGVPAEALGAPDLAAPAPAAPATPASKTAALGAPQGGQDGGARGRSPQPPSLGQAFAQAQDAAAAEIGAVQREGDVAAQKADAMFAARQAADQALGAAKADLERKLARDAEVRVEKQAAVDAANKEVDSFKIDQNGFWKGLGTGKKIGIFISMALAGLGDALAGKSGPNPVIGMLNDAIKTHVQLQMDQRDALRQKATRAGQALDAADRFSQNRLAQEQYLMAQALTMAGRQVETAGARFGAPEARARAQSMAAGYYKQAAEAGQKAAEFATADQRQREALAEQMKARQQQLGLGYSQLAETRRHNLAEEARVQREEEMKMALASAKARGESAEELMKLEKDASERALFNPSTGRPILRPEGRQMAKEAERLDALAEEAKDPEDAKRMRERAQALRGEAELRYPVKVAPARVKDLNDQVAAFQSAIGTIDRIIDLRREHGAKWATTTEGDQMMKSDWTSLAMMLKQGYQMGALDKGSMAAAEQMSGGDPTKITAGDVATWLGAKGTEAGLRELQKSLASMGYNVLGSAGVRDAGSLDAFKFRHAEDTKGLGLTDKVATLKAKTPGEFDAGLSPWGKMQLQTLEGAARAERAKTLAIPNREFADRPTESGRYAGLSTDQEVALDRMLDAATADPSTIADPVQRRAARNDAAQARKQIVDLAADAWKHGKGQRPEFAKGVAGALAQRAPDIYRDVLTTVHSDDLVDLAARGDRAAREVLVNRPKKQLTTRAENFLAPPSVVGPDGAPLPAPLPNAMGGEGSLDYDAMDANVLQALAARGDMEAAAELKSRPAAASPSMNIR